MDSGFLHGEKTNQVSANYFIQNILVVLIVHMVKVHSSASYKNKDWQNFNTLISNAIAVLLHVSTCVMVFVCFVVCQS